MNKINPISYFPNPADGRPISGGKLYIGLPDTDPTVPANQKQVYTLQEDGSYIAITQPVYLSVGGTPVYNGDNANLFVSGYYSIKVLTAAGEQVFYIPDSSADLDNEQIIFDTVADMVASNLVISTLYKTKGYYDSGDGGGATYLVKTSAAYGGTPDGYIDHYEASGNVLVLQHNGQLNLKNAGAIGDGATDSDANIRAAITFCIANDIPLYVPPGVFLLKKAAGITYLGDDQNLVVFGVGEVSVIKLGDGEITENDHRMFIFDVTPGNTANSILFQDLLVDNNTRGSVGPATAPADFTYEQAHTITVRALDPTAALKRARFINVGIKDPCADGWNVAGTPGGVYQFENINCHVRDRTRLRRDIQFSKPPRLAIIRGFRGTGIEAEHTTGSDTVGNCYLFISDTVVNIIDVLGYQSTSDPDYFRVFVDDVKCLDLEEIPDNNYAGARGASFSTCLLKLSNCEILLANSKQWVRLRKGSKISDSRFWCDIDGTTGEVTPLLIRDIETAYASDTTVVDCDFKILNDSPSYTAPSGTYLISDPTPKIGSGYTKRVINCTFDPRTDYSIGADRNGNWLLENNTYGGQTAAIFSTASAGYENKINIRGGDFSGVAGTMISFIATADLQLTMSGDHIGAAAATFTKRSGIVSTITAKSTRRLSHFSAAPAAGIIGDRVPIIAPTTISEYVCTASSESAATWKYVALV